MAAVIVGEGYRVRVRKHPTRPDCYSVFYRSNDKGKGCETWGYRLDVSAFDVCELLQELGQRQTCHGCGVYVSDRDARYLSGNRTCGDCAKAWWRS